MTFIRENLQDSNERTKCHRVLQSERMEESEKWRKLWMLMSLW